LQKGNNEYSHLKESNSANEILDFLNGRADINVVLDSGALVLEMSNELFAKKWLELRPDMEASVFFNSSDAVCVTTRNGAVQRFSLSPYAEDMSRCLLYLDDIHTRGSDFRLPIHSRGLLTLGKGMQKDKLVQAAMRMRQLGQGQHLTFLASKEVHLTLKKSFFKGEDDQNTDQNLKYVSGVLNWALSNTAKNICALVPYYAHQARNCIRKGIAFTQFYVGQSDSNIEALGTEVLDEEVLDLIELYGHDRGMVKLPEIVKRILRGISADEPTLPNKELSEQLQSLDISDRKETPASNAICQTIIKHVTKFAPNVELERSTLDEEQERELEAELEEETEVHRPQAAKHESSNLSGGLRSFIEHSNDVDQEVSCSGLFSLKDVFKLTSFKVLCEQFHCDSVFVTEDFLRNVKGDFLKDPYLKEVRWMFEADEKLVIVSNFEAEAFAAHLNSDLEPNLYAFAPISRLRQPHSNTMPLSLDPPPEIHILAGSIHATDRLLDSITTSLGLDPRPSDSKKVLFRSNGF
jgi:hypothetical protein